MMILTKTRKSANPSEQTNSYMPRPSGQTIRRPSVNDMDMKEIFDILGGND